jgi:hypothetical protein
MFLEPENNIFASGPHLPETLCHTKCCTPQPQTANLRGQFNTELFQRVSRFPEITGAACGHHVVNSVGPDAFRFMLVQPPPENRSEVIDVHLFQRDFFAAVCAPIYPFDIYAFRENLLSIKITQICYLLR